MRFVILMLLSLVLISCYKNKCYTCTVKRASSDYSLNSTTVYPEQYCGKKPKEIKALESEGTYTTMQTSSVTGLEVEVSVSTSCK